MPQWNPAPHPKDDRERCPVNGKLVFVSEREAEREAEWLNNKRGSKLRVYLCMHCDGWHFTSQETRF